MRTSTPTSIEGIFLGLKEYPRVAPRMDERGATDYARSLHSMVNTAAAMKRPAR